jgi:uncharacterized protein YraI
VPYRLIKPKLSVDKYQPIVLRSSPSCQCEFVCYTLQTVGNRVRSKLTIRPPTILAICIGLTSLFVSGPSPALAGDPPLVLAFYYAWYDQDIWTSGLPADRPTQPYSSSDPAILERHVSQAQGAGIDALIQSWYGPQEASNQTETNFRMLLDLASTKGFHAAVDFETAGPFFANQASVIDALRYLLRVHAQHPAYLRYEGKPVVFFWRQQRFSVDQWAAIRAQIDPNHDSLWIAEGVDIAYQAVFDGHHLYSIAWSPDVERTLIDWQFRLRRYESENNVSRLWIATVMPGYDDTHTDRADAFAVDRQDGEYYSQSWSAAMASQPDWILITSFNEWVEGTMIEPSRTYGDLYLNLTRDLATAFKSGSERDGELESQEDLPSEPYVRAEDAVRVRAGPGTSYSRLGRLSPGETAPAVGRNADDSWWQIEFLGVDGGLGWVTAEFVSFVGTPSSIPIISDVTLGATVVLSPTSTRLPTPSLTPRPPTPTPSRQPTLKRSSPTLTATPRPTPTPSPESPQPTLTPTSTGSPTTALTPATPAPLRTTPVPQRRPVALLWIGGGALGTALGLGIFLIRKLHGRRQF